MEEWMHIQEVVLNGNYRTLEQLLHQGSSQERKHQNQSPGMFYGLRLLHFNLSFFRAIAITHATQYKHWTIFKIYFYDNQMNRNQHIRLSVEWHN